MKWIKRIFWSFVLIIILIAGLGYLFARLMEEDVTNLVVRELNKNLLTTIQASNIRLSFLRKFPKASIEFRDVVAMSPKGFRRSEFRGGGDTLFRAQKVFLEMNLRDLMQKKYRVQTIHALNGKAWILTASDNSCNYIFWKSSSGKDTSQFRLEMQNVRLSAMDLVYNQRPAKLFVEAGLERCNMKGSFSKEQVLLHLGGKIDIHSVVKDRTVWIKNQKTDILCKIQANDRVYNFSEAQIRTTGFELKGAGKIDVSTGGKMNLSVGCASVDISVLASFLPEEYKNYITKYKIRGKAGLSVKINGTLTDPGIKVDYNLKNVSLAYPRRPIFEDIRAKGTYENPAGRSDTNVVIDINNFSLQTGGGNISGRIQILHPSSPRIRFAVDFNAPLATLQQLSIGDSIFGLKGNAKGNLTGEGSLTSFSAFRKDELANWNVSGTAKISDGFIEDRSNLYKIEKAEGTVYIGENLHLEDFSMVTGSNTYRLNIEVADISKWLFLPGQILKIGGNIYSPSLKFSFPSESKSSSGEKSEVPFIFPDSVYLDLDVAAGSLTAGRLQIKKFSGSLSYQPTMFTIHSMNIETMDGSLSGGAVLLQRLNKDILFRTQCRLDGLDICKLFYSFRNFGQDVLTDKHLKGKLSANINMQAEWDKYLHVKEESILAETSLEINDGELIKFEPMTGLSRFIEVSELEHIYFSKLKNEIFIRNRTITIPGMDINSSAFSLKLSGTHTFDNNFDYKVQVSMTEVLASKAKKARKENQEFGIVEADDNHRMNLFLVISGNFDDYKVNYDTRSAVKNLRTSLGKEKTTLRNIFRDEFGKKGQDSIPSLNGSEKKRPLFRMEFDAENDTIRPKKDVKKTKQPAFQIEWEELESDSSVSK